MIMCYYKPPLLVSNLEHSQKETVHILWDNRIQGSYISDKLRKQLRLTTIPKENIKIKTIRSNAFHSCTVDIVSLVLTGKEKLMYYISKITLCYQ